LKSTIKHEFPPSSDPQNGPSRYVSLVRHHNIGLWGEILTMEDTSQMLKDPK
jgi:hypothetical protein